MQNDECEVTEGKVKRLKDSRSETETGRCGDQQDEKLSFSHSRPQGTGVKRSN